MAASKKIIVKTLDELSENRMVRVLDPIRCLLRAVISKVLIVTFSVLLLLFLIVSTAPAQEATAHVVISEIQVADSEFVELYNPTDEDIDMAGWHWCYFSSGGNWDDPYRDKVFPGRATILTHGFYLIAVKSGEFSSADWNLEYKSHFLSNEKGSVGVFPWDPETKTAEEAKDGRIDAVAWGSVTYVKEEAEAAAPSPGKSIERKAQSTSTSETMGPGGADADRGNGYDSDDNSHDFVLRDSPEPQNSSSPKEIPYGPPVTATVTAYPTSIPADGTSTATITATVKDQYGKNVADTTVVTFTTSLGSLGSGTVIKATADGIATATLTAGTTPGMATVTATSDSASDRTMVTLFHQGLDPASVVTQVVSNSGTVDNKAGANTEVIIAAPDTCTTTAVSGLYTSNPGGPPSFIAFAGGYVDVQVLDAPCASQIEIRLYYPKDAPDEHLLRLYWWDGTTWRRCSDQRVKTADVDGYGGYIWARIRADTVPTLDDLTGTPFAGGFPPRPVGGVTLPVNKIELLIPWIGLAWLVLVAFAALAFELRRA